MLANCAQEKDIQVVCHRWELIAKDPASREVGDVQVDFVWLVWEDERGVKFRERVSDHDASMYRIGIVIYNRDRR